MQQKVLITGASGFLGQSILKVLKAEKKFKVRGISHKAFDLTDLNRAKAALRNVDIVIHTAGLVLSRIEQMQRPGEVFYQNVAAALNIAEAARLNGVKKLIFISSITAYPSGKLPLKEEDLWKGPPQGNMPYGYAKRITDVIAASYAQQYGIKTACVIFPNLYGPKDKFNFNPPPLVPSAIKQVHKAKKHNAKSLVAGNNGHHPVDLLYVDDAAKSLQLMLKKPNMPALINIGTGKSVKISKVFELVAKILNFKGKIIWQKGMKVSKRALNVSLMKKELHWAPKVSLQAGVEESVKNYLKK